MPGPPVGPAEVVGALRDLDPDIRLERYYGERSLFYNPGGVAPLGIMFASVKDGDGPNDRASALSRPGVFRLAFQLTPAEYESRFGDPPARPQKGGVVALDHDLAALGTLTPHPVYAWMRWVQILSPTAQQFSALRPLIEDSLSLARSKWNRRPARTAS